MKKKIIARLSFLTLLGALVLPCQQAVAQANDGAATSSAGPDVPFDAKDAFGSIIVSGLVGGIIGLSTLSFYEKPNDHLRNITLGAGIGLIGAALYMTYEIATTSVNEEAGPAEPDQSASFKIIPVLALDSAGLAFSANF